MAYPTIAIPIAEALSGASAGVATALGASSLMALPPALMLAGITSAFLPWKGGGASSIQRNPNGVIVAPSDATRVAQQPATFISRQYPGVYLASKKSAENTPAANPPATEAKPKTKSKKQAASAPVAQPTPEPEDPKKPRRNYKELSPFYGYNKGGFWPTVGRIVRDATYVNVGGPLVANGIIGLNTGKTPVKFPLTSYIPGVTMPWQENDSTTTPKYREIILPNGEKGLVEIKQDTQQPKDTVVVLDTFSDANPTKLDSLANAYYGRPN